MPTASRNVRVRRQSGNHVLALSSSQFDRCCRKSRKSNHAKNLANGDFWTTPPLRCFVVPIRKSVVVFLKRDVVPHVAAHRTHQQLQKVFVYPPKRLFRQHRSNSEVDPLERHVRSTPNSRHRRTTAACPGRAKRRHHERKSMRKRYVARQPPCDNQGLGTRSHSQDSDITIVTRFVRAEITRSPARVMVRWGRVAG